MYAFEPQTFADSGFYLRVLRVLCGKQVFPGSQLHAAIRKKSSGGGSRGGTRNCPGFPRKQIIVSRNLPPAARRA